MHLHRTDFFMFHKTGSLLQYIKARTAGAMQKDESGEEVPGGRDGRCGRTHSHKAAAIPLSSEPHQVAMGVNEGTVHQLFL